MNKYELAIYTEEKTVFEGEVEAMTAPGGAGYLGVWANHAPLLTSLMPGTLEVRFSRNEEKTYAVSGGFLEVAHNRAALLADSIEAPEEIDAERARESLGRARNRVEAPEADTDVERAQAAMARALNRLTVARAG